MKLIKVIVLFVGLTALFSGCDRNGDFVIFNIKQDIALGQKMKAQIAADPKFNLLDRTQYAEAYGYIDKMFNGILNSGQVAHKDVFPWAISIVRDDKTLNAFATPGGQVYVYTGLINYLDKSDDLAGVLGHEIAHADQRHSVKQMQKQSALSVLMQAVLGEDSKGAVGQLLGKLLSLKFSRSHETEADNYSVKYLSKTKYACNGAATFFEKLNAQGESRTPQFLSTHPSPKNRVSNINTKASEAGCETKPASDSDKEYAKLKNSLIAPSGS